MKRTCPICKARFHPRHGRQKMCSTSCSSVSQRERSRAAQERYRQTPGYIEKKRKYLKERWEKRLTYFRDYYLANKDKYRVNGRSWDEENRNKRRVWRKNREKLQRATYRACKDLGII